MQNIFSECTTYDVDLTKLSADLVEKICEEYHLDKDIDTYAIIYESDIKKYEIPEEAVNYDSYAFDEELLNDTLECYLGNHPHYLVFASACKWNGSSGYKFCDTLVSTAYRDYDINLVINEYVENKYIACTEYSHDRPTGSPTYIISLSEEQFNKLEDASFEEIETFVNNTCK